VRYNSRGSRRREPTTRSGVLAAASPREDEKDRRWLLFVRICRLRSAACARRSLSRPTKCPIRVRGRTDDEGRRLCAEAGYRAHGPGSVRECSSQRKTSRVLRAREQDIRASRASTLNYSEERRCKVEVAARGWADLGARWRAASLCGSTCASADALWGIR